MALDQIQIIQIQNGRLLTLNPNQFTLQGYIEPVYSTRVHRTSLQYKGTQNQVTVQQYTEPVYSTRVHRTSL